jgi:putative ATP-dependent endonuclease of OLD family
MRVARLSIENYRGIKKSNLLLPKHGVLLGDNNTGKTTVLEALDLVLGPDRLNRQPPIDEHDFFQGVYWHDLDDGVEQAQPQIEIEATVTDLSDEQKAKFGDFIEFWDHLLDDFYEEPSPEGVDDEDIQEALRITFIGRYDPEEDDFEGKTFFSRSLSEAQNPVLFSKKHKQLCGFLYLRTLRTGSRALSLERGSLLDIILRLKEFRPRMWENTITTLSSMSVADDPELGINSVLESVNDSLKKYVPKEWGVEPHLKVSNLTREHLRKIITAFIATGDGTHAAPFYRQGTGTINMLVLAMLSQIAEEKQNVIFAMEEPETAIPPYAQKRIVHEVRNLASQTLFTSHSPYVLEEFGIEETMVLARNEAGNLTRQNIELPDSVKLKRYRQEFRTRFCEGLLARRVLVAEGATEASAFPVACRRLAELNPDEYSSLEALGICTIDAASETNIPGMAELYKGLGKNTFAICDKQGQQNKVLIEEQVELLLMHEEKGFEDMVLKGTTSAARKRFAAGLEWPQHLTERYPNPTISALESLSDFFKWSKGSWGIADFLAQCSESEIPEWLRSSARELKQYCYPSDGDQDAGNDVFSEDFNEGDPDGAD